MRRCLFVVWLIFVNAIAAYPANGSSPRLNLIMPRGVQRGNEHVMRFSGQRLSDAREIFLYDQGVEVVSLTQVDGNNLDVTIRVSADCRLGEHVAQVRTARGISDFRSFFVGSLPDVQESEPNNSLDESEEISQNVTVNGLITNEDVDVFKFSATKDQRLSIEIEAMRLGFWFDSFIAILNDQNFEIAVSDDSILNQQDGIISFRVPEDGEYFVLVREASYGGNANCRYRLHVGNFPRPTTVLPAGGPADQEMELRFIGDPTGPIQRMISITERSGSEKGLHLTDDLGVTPSPVQFRISSLDNHFESEPDPDRRKIETTHTVPCAFNGIIATPGDHDHFKFSANKGEAFDVNCFARRIRSGLDPVINIFDASGKHIVGDDDARRPDCYIRFNAPESGDYVVRVRDHLGRGADDFVYRIEVDRVEPGLSISIPRVDRYSQLRQQLCVPQGNRFATLVSANRSNFGGELELIAEGLPDGVQMECRPMAANLNLMPVVFSASEDLPLSGSLVDLKARHLDPNRDIVGGFKLLADFSLGPPNNARYHACEVTRLAAAVTQKLPFSIEIVQPQVPLVRNGSMNLKIVARRDEGFDSPIYVQFPFRPPGLGTKPQIEIGKGKTEAYYPINANGNAQIGKWPVYAIGQADVDGPAWAASQLAELEIAEPYVTVEMNRASCERGSETSIYCKLNHRQTFEGEAKAELLGVPPEIKIPVLTFSKDTTELTFSVKTNDKSPLGKHKGLFCRLTIKENEEKIVSTAARSELQITKPAPKADPVAATSPPQSNPVQKPEKPKSRLQKLRDAAVQKRGQ